MAVGGRACSFCRGRRSAITGRLIKEQISRRSKQALKAWYREVKQAQWSSANELKQKYGSASVLKKGRVVFNICGQQVQAGGWSELLR